MVGDKISFRWLIAAVVAALLAALISAGVIVANRDADNSKANTAEIDPAAATPTSVAPTAVPAATGGAEVRACMAQHQMSRTAITSTTTVEARGTLPGETPETAQLDNVTIFRRCDWPPKTWSDGDGYSEIWVQPTIGPGETEATSANVADVIKSRCDRLQVSYSIVAQGYQKSLPAFISEPNRTVWHDGRTYRAPPQKQLNFYYERDELIVLRNAKIRLDRVKCVK
jgi:hypothetical protein